MDEEKKEKKLENDDQIKRNGTNKQEEAFLSTTAISYRFRPSSSSFRDQKDGVVIRTSFIFPSSFNPPPQKISHM